MRRPAGRPRGAGAGGRPRRVAPVAPPLRADEQAASTARAAGGDEEEAGAARDREPAAVGRPGDTLRRPDEALLTGVEVQDVRPAPVEVRDPAPVRRPRRRELVA